MSKAVKYAERAVTVAAQGAWSVFDKLNSISPNKSFTPKWSDKPLLKSYQKEKPPLGWPRTTDSLCPTVRPRDPPADRRRQAAPRDPSQREGRRDQGPDHRARRQDPHGQGLPHPRPLRGRHVHRPRLLQAPRRGLPRPRHPRPQRRASCTTMGRPPSPTAAARF